MAAVTAARYRAAARAAFEELLSGWASALPPEGWTGTTAELHRELGAAAAGGRPVYVPAGAGLAQWVRDAAPALAAVGWLVAFARTKAARSIRFARAG